MRIFRYLPVFKYFLLLPLLGISMLAQAALADTTPLVDGRWALEHLGNDDVLFLDIQPAVQYRKYHIPGAINAPYSGWRTGKKQPPKGMLPPVEALQKKLGKLGIDAGKRVIVAATGNGAGDMAAAARVFWTLQLLGHRNVAILNGGLIAYAEANGKLEKGVNSPRAVRFKGRPNMALLAQLEDMKKATEAKTALVDARSVAEYLGIYKGGKKERPGTIPGSRNLPFDWLTVNGSGEIHSADNLENIFRLKGIQTKEPRERIHYCHTGNRAALNWFVDYALLGNQKARLYDGSTKEWSSRRDTAVKAEIELWK